MSKSIPFQLRICKHILLILLASGILAGLVNLIHPNSIHWVQDWSNYVESKAKDANIEMIPLGVAFSRHQAGDHVFVDARASSEFSKGHISGAVSIPFENMDENFDVLMQLLGTGNPLVVYCRNRECDDALLLAVELRDMGKSNLYYYVDGYEIWEESRCPIQTE